MSGVSQSPHDQIRRRRQLLTTATQIHPLSYQLGKLRSFAGSSGADLVGPMGAALTVSAAFTVFSRCSPHDLVRLWCGLRCDSFRTATSPDSACARR